MMQSLMESRARVMQSEIGGRIFAFPVDMDDPLSQYAIVMDMGSQQFKAYPNPVHISDAAGCILALLEGLDEQGESFDYEKDVRLISGLAQLNGPDVTMRRMKKQMEAKPVFASGIDVSTNPDDPEQHLISARGIIKFSYLEMLDKNPKGIQFMEGYYRLLAMRRYGKTAAAIKQEIRRMSKEEGLRWVESTYKRFIHNDVEIMDLMKSLKGAST